MQNYTDWLVSIGQYVVMAWTTLRLISTQLPKKDLIIPQFYEIGVCSLPLISTTGLAIGMVLSAQSFFQLSDKGLTGITGVMVAKSMLVEIGPILTAFMLTGRVGASMCAELGSMKVTEQIDAMQSMGVNPLSYLLAPRYIAFLCMMPILTIFSSTFGIFGGWLVATKLYNMPSQAFLDPIPIYLSWYDILTNLIKSEVFGLIIVSIACFKGLLTRGGASGVGRATTESVVITYSSILGINFLLTIFFNAIYWYIY